VVGNHSFIQVAANLTTAYALKADGTAWALGNNGNGQLGDRSTANKSSPISVHGAHSFIQVAAGSYTGYALKADGSVWSWGAGANGALGDFTATSKSSPVSVVGNHSFVFIVGGYGSATGAAAYCLGRKADGTVWGWGNNSEGQLGNSLTTSVSSPVSVVGNHSFVMIDAKGRNGIGLKSDGTLWIWGGGGFYGELANGKRGGANYSSPIPIVTQDLFVQVCAGWYHSFGLKSDGSAWGWGNNQSGQIGDFTQTTRSNPTSVLGNHSFVQVRCGGQSTYALKSNGTAWAWGYNSSGRLGNRSTTNTSSPISVHGDHSFIALYGGTNAGYGLKSNGTAWGWGVNTAGELGDNSLTSRSSPVSVVGNHSFIALAPAKSHVIGVKADGTVWAWGSGIKGRLGNNNIITTSSPISVIGAHSFVAIGAGTNSETSMAFKTDGQIWTWGPYNLGNNIAMIDYSSPTVIDNNLSFKEVSTGGASSYALRSDGTIYSWGQNDAGQLGYGGTVDTESPAQVSSIASYVSIHVGAKHVLARGADNIARVWGQNTSGQLGTMIDVLNYPTPYALGLNNPVRVHAGPQNAFIHMNNGLVWAIGYGADGALGDNITGSTTTKSIPTLVAGNHSFVKISAGYNGCAALKADGTCWGWGGNAQGQLGNLTATAQSSPISVLGNHSFIDIIRAQSSSGVYGLKSDGTLWAWGNGGVGQLGRGDYVSQSSPISVIGNHSFISVSTRTSHVLAVKADGSIWAWGGNSFYESGVDAFAINRSSPVSVANDHSFVSITMGNVHTAALKPDETSWYWGYGANGQLGDNSTNSKSYPYQGATSGNHRFVQLATYLSTSFGLKSNGTVWSFGSGSSGILGNNTSGTAVSSPVSVVGNHSFISISVGVNAMALKADGTAWGWGYNGTGATSLIGNMSATNTSSPVSVFGNHSFIKLVACKGGSSGATVALKADGTCWAWGNSGGVIGDGTNTARSSPVSVVGNHSFIDISNAENATGALKADGTIWTWGIGLSGQLGNNSTTDTNSPVSVVGDHSFVQISGYGRYGFFAKKADGTVWGWGANGVGQLGDGTNTGKSSPVSVIGNHSFVSIAVNGYQGLAGIKEDGSAWTWGACYSSGCNSLGNGYLMYKPLQVMPSKSFVKVIAGFNSSYGITDNGEVYVWGDCTNNKLNIGSASVVSSPILMIDCINDQRKDARLHANSFAKLFSGQGSATFGVKEDGEVWSWGSNYCYLLGRTYNAGANYLTIVPDRINNLKVSHVAVGLSHVIAVRRDGTCWGWGANVDGQLGDNTVTLASSPVSVVGNHIFVSVYTSSLTSYGLKSDGTCWAWGNSVNGGLGNNTVTNTSSPVSVVGNHSFISLAPAINHILALKSDGACWVWGRWYQGCLADNGGVDRSSPVSVIGNHSFIQIGATYYSSYGFKSDGTVWAWGRNANGELGDNTATNKSSPVSVVGNHSFIQMQVMGQNNGDAKVFGLKADGSVWGWGYNGAYYLADGTATTRSSPVSVLGSARVSFASIVGSERVCYGMKTNGEVWAWGYPINSEFGNGTIPGSFEWSTPTAVISRLVNHIR
jgi:alpha-tubulin suppressor-like RCC1 family protein